MKKAGTWGLVIMLGAVTACAEVATETVEYKHGETVLEGYFAFDDASSALRPAVLVVHDWMGPSPYVRKRAEQLAKLGYAAFALDMYGKNIRPKDGKEASAQAGKYKSDRALMRARAQAGLERFMKHSMHEGHRLFDRHFAEEIDSEKGPL